MPYGTLLSGSEASRSSFLEFVLQAVALFSDLLPNKARLRDGLFNALKMSLKFRHHPPFILSSPFLYLS